jgi:excisionase family DNA binding protein
MPRDGLVSIRELAQHLGVDPRTVRRWLSKGVATKLYVGAGRLRRVRISAEDAEKLSGGTWRHRGQMDQLIH